jgi:pyridoxamine 5'-phosphate oxidase
MIDEWHSIRKQYGKFSLEQGMMDPNPLSQFQSWLQDAVESGCPEPTAMALSTVGSDYRPSSRIVLFKGFEQDGLLFFSNYQSRKGTELASNPLASVLFFWPQLERQVRIEGRVEKTDEAISDAYFRSRPEASRTSASISPQSREIPGRGWLENRRRTADGGRPSFWGGYRLVPDYFEFWQGREDRLHDRLAYKPGSNGWLIVRLAP